MTSPGCPSDHALVALAEDRLSLPARASLVAHLDQCHDCRAVLIDLAYLIPIDEPAADDSARFGARYELRGELGSGGMGVVFEAWDRVLARPVAIKRMRPDRTAPSGSDELMREARALARLSHPNVLVVHDAGRDGEVVYIATELVDGLTAAKLLSDDSTAWPERLEVFLQVAEGLSAAHTAGIVHGDVKPQNVLIGQDGRARLADFGLACSVRAVASRGGTPPYMAPELREGTGATAHADQFALCICMVEAMTGSRPTAGISATALASMESAAGISRVPPAAVWTVLARGLSAEPDERFPDIAALASAVAETLVQNPVPVTVSRRLRWQQAAAAVAALIAVGVVLAVTGGGPPGSMPMGMAAAPRSSQAGQSLPTPTGQLAAAMAAFNRRDGAGCLALLKAADTPTPSQQAALLPLRPLCTMLAGECEAGRRQYAELLRSADQINVDAAVRTAANQYCPLTDGSPAQRVERLVAQASGGPHDHDRCSLLTRVADELAAPLADNGAAGRVWWHIGECWARAGECDRGRAAIETALTREPGLAAPGLSRPVVIDRALPHCATPTSTETP